MQKILLFLSALLWVGLSTSQAQLGWSKKNLIDNNTQLKDVHAADMNNVWVVGANGLILNTNNGGTNWRAQASGTNQNLNSVHFASSTTGWTVGNAGAILMTSNGGSNWTAQASGTTQNLSSVHFTSSTQGWAVGASGTILMTSNGGSTWTAQASGTTQNLNSVHFASNTHGWAVGASGTVLMTSNGGSTWTAQTSGTTQTLNGVFALSSTQAWIGGNGNTFLTTTNGTSWSNQALYANQPNAVVMQPHFFSATEGFAFADNNQIKYTNNGGTTWTNRGGWEACSLIAFSCISNTLNFAICPTNINQTTDGFTTFLTQQLSAADKKDISFANSTEGYIATLYSTMLKTTDNGTNWSLINQLGICVDAPSTNNLWIGLGAGSFGVSNNGGTTWTSNQQGVGLPNQVDIQMLSNTKGISANTDGSVYYTTNGTSWVRATCTTVALSSVSFVADTTALVVGANGIILKSRDGGATWTTQTSSTTATLNSVFFTTPTQGWVAGANGTILTTSNGGSTWTAQTSGTTATLNAVFFTSSLQGWAVGNNGTIITTADGGASWLPQTSGVSQHIYAIHMHSATDGWAVGQGGLMLKYQNVTSVEQTSADAANISLYPNPVYDQLTILNEGQANESTFRLLDQTGRQIISGKLNIGANQINVSELPAGMYFIQIQGAQKAYKVIKL